MSHALFAPSAATRWLTCAYSVLMSQLFISTSSAAATEGSLKHDEADQHLKKDTDSDNAKLQLYINTVRRFPGELTSEKKVIIVPELCEGTADAVAIDDYTFIIGDLKWGKHPVSPVNNAQEKTYALGVLRENPIPRDELVKLFIIQPNTKQPVRSWGIYVEQLLEFRDEVHKAIDLGLTAIDRGIGADTQAVAGKHCYWCPGKLHCDTYLKKGK